MKKNTRILFLLGFLFATPMFVKAQKSADNDLYNDSTEHIIVQEVITDTAAVEAFVNVYRTRWREELDSLEKMEEVLVEIKERKGKKFPETMIPDLRMLLSWIKANEYKDNRYRMGERFVEIEFDNIEKQLEKGKIHRQLVELAPSFSIRVSSELSHVEQSLAMETFWKYSQLKPYTKYPQKTIDVKKKNPRYRPNVFMSARETSDNWISGGLATLEYATLEQGWEWMRNDKYQNTEESYPVSFSYRKYDSHPEYKVLYVGTNGLLQVCDKDGKLVRTSGPERTSYGEVNDIIKYLIQQECRKDYDANKYDIKKEGPEVHYSIKYQLGYFSEAEKKSKSPYKVYNSTASKYIEQLQRDHKNDFKYLYEIRRISNTSFLFRFVTYEMEPKYDVKVTYFTTKPFSVDKKVERL